MLADRRECACSTHDISPGGLAVTAELRPAAGEIVIVYLEVLGRIEGVVVRHFADGFAMTIRASATRREKLASQLTWLINQAEIEDSSRKHQRIVPKNREVTIIDAIGRKNIATVENLSRSGAALKVKGRYVPQSIIRIGETKAQVMRVLEDGIAVSFLIPIPVEHFDADVQL